MAAFVRKSCTDMTVEELVDAFKLACEVYDYGLDSQGMQTAEEYIRSRYREFRCGQTIIYPVNENIRFWAQPFTRMDESPKVYFSPGREGAESEEQSERYRAGLSRIFDGVEIS